MLNFYKKQNDLKSVNEENFKSLGFFSNGDHFHYTFKKTEKIVQALYMVTSHIDSNEPIKFEIREKALSFLASSLTLNSVHSYDENNSTISFFTTALELTTLITISAVSGLISESNAGILSHEINEIVAFLKNHLFPHSDTKGLILSEDFFATDVPPTPESHQGQVKKQLPSTVPSKDQNVAIIKDSIKDKKSDRQHEILELLKKQNDLTVKDFSSVIKDCSEKTIQRELIALVEKGVVKREGERRWSRYSLKK